MKVTLELLPINCDTSKVGIKYIVSNVKFDNIYVETILDTNITNEDNTKYSTMATAISEYFDKLSFALHPVN